MNKKDFNGFYFRCVSCNDTLTKEYQEVGLCSTCKTVVRNASHPDRIVTDNIFAEYILWSNPMDGGLNGEDAEEDYQGGNTDD